MNLYTKQKDSQKTNLWLVTKGEREWEGEIRSMGLTDTNYYTENR